MDYFIPKGFKGGIQLEILNSMNEVVSTILSDSTQIKSSVKEVEDMDLSQTFRYVDKKLIGKPGMHRFEWDLRQIGAWAKDKKKRFKNGPLVAPGTYTARLTVDKNSYEQSFDILIDPRVKDEGITEQDITSQLIMQNKIISLLSEARKLEVSIEKEAKSLKGKKAQAKVSRLEKINSILKQLKNDNGAYPQQMLSSQISYVLNMISRADQIPGQDAIERLDDLQNQFNKIKEDVKK
jgi:hypothetical protein